MGQHRSKIQVSVYIDPDLREAGKIVALRRRVTFSVLLEEALALYLGLPAPATQEAQEKAAP
jgi:hypothetical protein